MNAWFLKPELMDQRNEALSRPEFLEALGRVTLEPEAATAPTEREGKTAVIRIEGILSPKPDPIAELFGLDGTTYPGIIAAVRAADTDPDVTAIRLDIDSPGGTVAGAFETAEAISAARKPVSARVYSEAASAAYLLASQAKRIEAVGPASMVGSLGIVAVGRINPERVEVTSTEAPDKRPDLSTDAGKQVVREQLDQLHSLMVETIARGRGVTPEIVNEKFGRGRMLTARPALERGMIDAAGLDGAAIGAKNTGGQKRMDLQELKTQHPEAYTAAVADGVAQERARVASHLKLASRPGCQEIAIAAITNGDQMSPDLAGKYADAAVAAAALAARAEDEPAPVAPEPVNEPADDTADKVAAIVARNFGMEE